MNLVLLEIDCDWDDQQLARIEQLLPEDVQTRASRYLVAGARQNLIATQWTLRQVIRGLEFDESKLSTEPNGRPLLADSPLEFNLSHSHRRGVLGLALDSRLQDCLGVDVEWTERSIERVSLARRFFTANESRLVMKDPENTSFFRIWTRKEAILKSNGIGLRVPLDSFEVLEDRVSQKVSGRPLNLFTEHREGGYLVSWALPEECEKLDVVWVSTRSDTWLEETLSALKS